MTGRIRELKGTFFRIREYHLPNPKHEAGRGENPAGIFPVGQAENFPRDRQQHGQRGGTHGMNLFPGGMLPGRGSIRVEMDPDYRHPFISRSHILLLPAYAGREDYRTQKHYRS